LLIFFIILYLLKINGRLFSFFLKIRKRVTDDLIVINRKLIKNCSLAIM
jgi:hypothetical protein